MKLWSLGARGEKLYIQVVVQKSSHSFRDSNHTKSKSISMGYPPLSWVGWWPIILTGAGDL